MPTKGKQKRITAVNKADSKQSPSTKPVPPKWPPIHPLVPKSDLSTQVLLPNQIILIPNFWTSTLCKTYVDFLASLPLVTTPGKPKKGEAVRVNDRFQIEDAAFAEELWCSTTLKDLVLGNEHELEEGMGVEDRRQLWGGDVVGLNQNIRIYKYSK
ncbi:MAG: hypothetical protein M1835_007269, partial [Candelina submexicana]